MNTPNESAPAGDCVLVPRSKLRDWRDLIAREFGPECTEAIELRDVIDKAASPLQATGGELREVVEKLTTLMHAINRRAEVKGDRFDGWGDDLRSIIDALATNHAIAPGGDAEELALWLDAKYRRHGEDEDRRAAALIRQLAALSGHVAQEASQPVMPDGSWKVPADPPAAGDGWNPIETIPRDGSRVELLAANGKTDFGHWYAFAEWNEPSDDVTDHLNTDNGEGDYTHWRLLAAQEAKTNG